MIVLKGVKKEIVVKCYARVLGDNGKVTTVPFSSTWKKLEVEDALNVLEKIQVAARKKSGNEKDTDPDIDFDERAIIDENLVNLSGLCDLEDNEEFIFDAHLVDALMKSREYKAALMNAFFEAQTGRKQLAIKN